MVQWFRRCQHPPPLEFVEQSFLRAREKVSSEKGTAEFLCAFCTDSFLITFNHLAAKTFYYVFIVEKSLIHRAGPYGAAVRE